MFGLNDTDTLRFVYLAVLLVLLVGSIGLGRTRGAAKFRHLGIWILVAAALVIVYTYRGPVLGYGGAGAARADAEPRRARSPARTASISSSFAAPMTGTSRSTRK